MERLQTRFGPTSFTLKAEADRITGTIKLPTRYRPRVAKLRLRTGGTLSSVKLNGKAVPFDERSQTVTLPEGVVRAEVQATIAR